jgi:hypothetical protein
MQSPPTTHHHDLPIQQRIFFLILHVIMFNIIAHCFVASMFPLIFLLLFSFTLQNYFIATHHSPIIVILSLQLIFWLHLSPCNLLFLTLQVIIYKCTCDKIATTIVQNGVALEYTNMNNIKSLLMHTMVTNKIRFMW